MELVIPVTLATSVQIVAESESVTANRQNRYFCPKVDIVGVYSRHLS